MAANPWEEYKADEPWAEYGASAPAAAPPEPKSFMGQWKSNFDRMLPAPFQTALQLASGFGGTVAGGIGGVGRTILTGDPEQGAQTVRRVQDALTYEPTKKDAQTASKVIGWLPQKYEQGTDWLGANATDVTGSPLYGTAIKTGMDAIPQALGFRFPGTKASAFERALPGGELPGSAAARNAARVAALQKDTAATAAKEAGFVLPPTQVNPRLTNQVLEGIGGTKQLAQELSEKNQPLQQAKIRQDLNIPPEQPLNLDTYEQVRGRASEPYGRLAEAAEGTLRTEIPPAIPTGRMKIHTDENGVQSVIPQTTQEKPYVRRGGLEVSDDFRASVGGRRDTIRAKLEEDPETFAALKPSLNLLDSALKRSEMKPEFVVDRIKQLRSDAKKNFDAPDPAKVEIARTRLQLADDIEGLVEQNLIEKGDFASLKQFREARKEVAKSYSAEKATLGTGEIYARALADAKKRGVPLEGGMNEIANLDTFFPKATQIPSRIGGTPAINPIDVSTAVIGHAIGGPSNWLSAAVGPIRAGARGLLKSDFYQRNMVNPPTYGPSLGSRAVKALQAPGVIPGLESLGLDERRKELLRQLLER